MLHRTLVFGTVAMAGLRAIDLYAGIGGWSLGLRLAGIDVVASYEWWQPAIDTHNGNHGGDLKPVDIRKLDFTMLPTDIDIVVGSPPCTEFSYSNRGGSGDLAEGLKDLVRFFEVVDHLKPSSWAMENVPRVAEVLRHGFATKGHALYRFRHLGAQVEVIDFSDYGTPQARRRCIATNIPLVRVQAYRAKISGRTLGDVVTALAGTGHVVDPIWGTTLPVSQLTETQVEPPLRGEELRMNREAKEFHPIYNNMAFPDALDAPSRTVTATCTRVSRESIVITDPKRPDSFRRLTIRERACLQGFPITYQFHARSFAEKAKMVGNAIPPTFTYLLALAAQDVSVEAFGGHVDAAQKLHLPEKVARVTPPDGEGRTYPLSRSFRAAIPGLRFKSGMRFELANSVTADATAWRVRFMFGPSKDIREIELDGQVTKDLRQGDLLGAVLRGFQGELTKASRAFAASGPVALQLAWAHKTHGLRPYEVVDQLGTLAAELLARVEEALDDDGVALAADYILLVADSSGRPARRVGEGKLRRYALPVLVGLVIGEWFNALDWHNERRAAA